MSMIRPFTAGSNKPFANVHPSLPFAMLKLLGRGGEGEVYQVEDITNGQRYVYKSFKGPLGVTSVEALKVLSSSYQPNSIGLAQLELVWDQQELVALYYPFEELHTLHYRILKSAQPIAQAMLAAFCRLQSHLLGCYNVIITDTVSDHFLLDRSGCFHYIDYGISVKPANHPRVRANGMLEYGLAMLLLNIYNNNLKRELSPLPGYRTNTTHAYFHSQRIQNLAGQQPWVARLLKCIDLSAPEDFYNPNFYLSLVDGFPTQVKYPQAVLLLSKLLHRLK